MLARRLVRLLARLRAVLRALARRGDRLSSTAAEALPEPAPPPPQAPTPEPVTVAAAPHGAVPAHEDTWSAAVLWFGLLGAQGAWFAQLMLGYMLVPAACEIGSSSPLYAVSAAAAAVAGASIAVAWKSWASARGRRPRDETISSARIRLMGLAGLLLGALALGLIVVTAASPAAIGPCE